MNKKTIIFSILTLLSYASAHANALDVVKNGLSKADKSIGAIGRSVANVIETYPNLIPAVMAGAYFSCVFYLINQDRIKRIARRISCSPMAALCTGAASGAIVTAALIKNQ